MRATVNHLSCFPAALPPLQIIQSGQPLSDDHVQYFMYQASRKLPLRPPLPLAARSIDRLLAPLLTLRPRTNSGQQGMQALHPVSPSSQQKPVGLSSDQPRQFDAMSLSETSFANSMS